MPPTSKGFGGRRADVDPGRVPPGQYVTRDFPVLSAGPAPHTPLYEWSFTIHGAVDEPTSWTWEEFLALPSESCWTRSRLTPATSRSGATTATRRTSRSRI
jgi:DMSO/TMAO reductase YedYZ molybdopterin-dependent catalytic subunit